MDYNMYMSLPIQERRAFIHKHKQEQEELNNKYNSPEGSNVRKYEGESINTFAKMEQSNSHNFKR